MKVDIVYGTAPKVTTEAPYVFNLKTSLQYLESDNSIMYSGSPGYIKGKPLLVGTTLVDVPVVGSTSTVGVQYNLNGFSLRGADNDGKCYYLKNGITPKRSTAYEYDEDFTANEMTVDSIDDKMYFDDPVLTFEDSIIYGCTIELNAEELHDFCLNGKWRNLMIFQNLLSLDVVGSSGNANPHFSKDWENISIDDEDKFPKARAIDAQDAENDACDFPGVRVVRIFYQKINTESNPQYIITKMQHYQDKSNKWKFMNPDKTKKQKFSPMVTVNFYEEDQDLELYKPVPIRGKPIPKNTLYPFYVFG